MLGQFIDVGTPQWRYLGTHYNLIACLAAMVSLVLSIVRYKIHIYDILRWGACDRGGHVPGHQPGLYTSLMAVAHCGSCELGPPPPYRGPPSDCRERAMHVRVSLGLAETFI